MPQPSRSQISSHSSLSGALTPKTWPLYELPQTTYNQNARTTSSRSMRSIPFQQRNGTSWLPLRALRTNHKDLADAMVGGWDLVFPSRSSIQTQINFSITWPGYNADDSTRLSIVLTLETHTTTRAMLAKIIGFQVELFMDRAAVNFSTERHYNIGRDSIWKDRVLIAGIENTHGNAWQAKIIIDNLAQNN